MTAALFAAAVVGISGPVQEKSFTEELSEHLVKFEMAYVPGGDVMVGDERVAVEPFFMATTEIPWEVFDAFLLSGEPSKPYNQTEFGPDAIARPSRTYILPDLGWGHIGYPVINVSWLTAEMFCRWLSKVTGREYRLPTVAEWELAAGADGGFDGEIDAVAWHSGNSGDTTHPVGKRAPNQYGIYDLLGNVGEWATDLKGEPILCGPTFIDKPDDFDPETKRRYSMAWQADDPQLPKSRWWLSNGYFVGFRLVCEP